MPRILFPILVLLFEVPLAIAVEMPADVNAIMSRSCTACHYHRSYRDTARVIRQRASIIRAIENGSMPLKGNQYAFRPGEKAKLLAWLRDPTGQPQSVNQAANDERRAPPAAGTVSRGRKDLGRESGDAGRSPVPLPKPPVSTISAPVLPAPEIVAPSAPSPAAQEQGPASVPPISILKVKVQPVIPVAKADSSPATIPSDSAPPVVQLVSPDSSQPSAKPIAVEAQPVKPAQDSNISKESSTPTSWLGELGASIGQKISSLFSRAPAKAETPGDQGDVRYATADCWQSIVESRRGKDVFAKRMAAEKVLVSTCLVCHSVHDSIFASSAVKLGKIGPFIETNFFSTGGRLNEINLIASGAIVPGDPDNSSFFNSIDEGRMPHRGMRQASGHRLPDRDVTIVREWIAAMKPSQACIATETASRPVSQGVK